MRKREEPHSLQVW